MNVSFWHYLLERWTFSISQLYIVQNIYFSQCFSLSDMGTNRWAGNPHGALAAYLQEKECDKQYKAPKSVRFPSLKSPLIHPKPLTSVRQVASQLRTGNAIITSYFQWFFIYYRWTMWSGTVLPECSFLPKRVQNKNIQAKPGHLYDVQKHVLFDTLMLHLMRQC